MPALPGLGLITEPVPAGVPFTGILRTRNASPASGLVGVCLGVLTFLTLTPVVVSALIGAYWVAVGRPGTFADTYRSLIAYQHPWGMAASQMGLALLIPISLLLVAVVHHVRPGYVISVTGVLRWRPFWIWLGVATLVFNAILALATWAAGKPWQVTPQPDLVGFLVAIALTTPLQAAAEEFFFRGYLLEAFGALSTNRWVGILASALLFAVFHGAQNPLLFTSRFAFGVMAAWLVVAVGGIEAGIAAHVVNNVFAFVYAGLGPGIASLKATTSVTWQDAATEIGMYAVFTGAAWWAGRRLRVETRTPGRI